MGTIRERLKNGFIYFTVLFLLAGTTVVLYRLGNCISHQVHSSPSNIKRGEQTARQDAGRLILITSPLSNPPRTRSALSNRSDDHLPSYRGLNGYS